MKVLTIIVSVLILIAVLIPGSNIPDVGMVGLDKLVHVCMFTVWAVAFRFDFPGIRTWVVFLCGVAFSLLTEVVQLFVEGRSFDFFDMIFDGLGLVIGLLIAKTVIKMINRLFRPKT